MQQPIELQPSLMGRWNISAVACELYHCDEMPPLLALGIELIESGTNDLLFETIWWNDGTQRHPIYTLLGQTIPDRTDVEVRIKDNSLDDLHEPENYEIACQLYAEYPIIVEEK